MVSIILECSIMYWTCIYMVFCALVKVNSNFFSRRRGGTKLDIGERMIKQLSLLRIGRHFWFYPFGNLRQLVQGKGFSELLVLALLGQYRLEVTAWKSQCKGFICCTQKCAATSYGLSGSYYADGAKLETC